MALVVADTSPLRFLVEIGYENVLPRLFQQVWIPGAVARELRHERTPASVRQWAERLPGWVHVREIGNSGFDPGSADIDRGEWEAIELARDIHANLLLSMIVPVFRPLANRVYGHRNFGRSGRSRRFGPDRDRKRARTAGRDKVSPDAGAVCQDREVGP